MHLGWAWINSLPSFSFRRDELLPTGRPRFGLLAQQLECDARQHVHLRFLRQPGGLHRHAHRPIPYAGRDFDSEDGLHYNRHRFYDSNVGRFISGDPTGFSGGINFYHYVGNSPVGNVDPLGLARCTFIVSQGTLWCWPQQPGHNGVFINVASGNNGHGMHCKNNPDCDLLRDRGPLPRGWWRWTNGPTGKLNGRVLVPMPGTYNGRSLIRSHSCKNPFGPSVDSPFCSRMYDRNTRRHSAIEQADRLRT